MNLARAQVRAGLATPVGQGAELVFGPSVRFADASVPEPEIEADPLADELLPTPPALGLDPGAFDAQTHAGGFGRFQLSAVDRPANPRQGLRLAVEGGLDAGVSGPAQTYGTVLGELAAYVPLGITPQLTLALRGGAETRIGDFPFFDAAVLGGAGSLRGYRRERFAGRTAASASAELRAKLFDLNTYVLPLDVGVLGFVDGGRVWAGDPPDCLQDAPCFDVGGGGLQLGYGGGLWFGLLEQAVFNVSVGVSDEATLVTAGLGFAY